MKTSFKTITLIAAIGMIVYTLYITGHFAIHELLSTSYYFNLRSNICMRLMFDILPVSLIVAGLGLYKQRPVNITKPFRILTICLFVALIGTLVFSYPTYTPHIAGVMYLFPSFYWRIILLTAGIAWLFMLRNQPMEDATPRSYQVTLIIAMVLLALPVVLEAISGIALLSGREMVVGFQSGAIKTWVKYIAPVLLLSQFIPFRTKLKGIKLKENAIIPD